MKPCNWKNTYASQLIYVIVWCLLLTTPNGNVIPSELDSHISCNKHLQNIEKNSEIIDFNSLQAKLNHELCSVQNSLVNFYIGKILYLIGNKDEFKIAIRYLRQAIQGASISDSFYSPARYYLTLIYLKTDPLKLDTNIFIQAQRHDLTKNLENEVRNQIIALHTTVFERYINDPFKEIYPSQFIKIMDILKINRTDQIKKIRDVIQKIQMVQQQKQTVSQIQELMKLHKKLQLMNVPVQVEIERLNNYILYFKELEKAENNPISACDHYKQALYLQQKHGIDNSDLNIGCKIEISCLNNDINNAFENLLDSLIINDSAQQSNIITYLSDKWLTISEDCPFIEDLNHVKLNLNAYIDLHIIINKFSIKRLNEVLHANKSSHLIKVHQQRLLKSVFNYRMKYFNKQLHQTQYYWEITDAQHKLLDIHSALQNEYNDCQSIQYQKLLLSILQKVNNLNQVFRLLIQHKGKDVLALKDKIAPDLWSAWHVDRFLGKTKQVIVKLIPPENIPYSFVGYQIRCQSDLNMQSKIYNVYNPDNTCLLRIPVCSQCRLELMNDYDNKAYFLMNISQNRILAQDDQPVQVYVPEKLFVNHTFELNGKIPTLEGEVKIVICKPSSLKDIHKQLPVHSNDIFKNNKVKMYLIPGVYCYNINFNDENILNIWFRKAVVCTLLNDKTVVSLTTNNMTSQSKADQIFNNYVNNTNTLTDNDYLWYARGSKQFMRYFVTWLIHFNTSDNATIIWNKMIVPLFKGEFEKWYHLYLDEQIQLLGLKINNTVKQHLSKYFKNMFCLILHKDQCEKIAKNDRNQYIQLFLSLKQRGYINNKLIYQIEEVLNNVN